MRVGLSVLLDPEVGSSNRELSDHHTPRFVFETLQLDCVERSLVVLDGPRRISDREPRCDFRCGQLSPRRITAHTQLHYRPLETGCCRKREPGVEKIGRRKSAFRSGWTVGLAQREQGCQRVQQARTYWQTFGCRRRCCARQKQWVSLV